MQAMIIDQKLKSLVASERKITHEILLLIQTLDITKSYRELGYSSLFEYLTKEIGYSEGSAQRRISSARLMKQVPMVEKKLQSGEMNLTQASLVQTAIRQEEKAVGAKVSCEKKLEILNQLKAKSTFDTQKILKESLPHFEIPKPKAVPSGSDKVFVTMEFSSQDWDKVQSLMAHFSHSVPDQKLESLLLHWCDQVEAKKQKQRMRILKTGQIKTASAQKFNAGQVKAASSQKFNAGQMKEASTQKFKTGLEKAARTHKFKTGLEKAARTQKFKTDRVKTARAEVQKADQELQHTSSDEITADLSSAEILPPLRRQTKSEMQENQEIARSIEIRPKGSRASVIDTQSLVKRTKAPVQIKIQIRDRAQDRCEFVSSINGRRCDCKVFLEDEHIVPLAKGGSNLVSNYRLFCRAHNQLMAKIWGVGKALPVS